MESSRQTDKKPKACLNVWYVLAPGERQRRNNNWLSHSLLDTVPATHTHGHVHTRSCGRCANIQTYWNNSPVSALARSVGGQTEAPAVNYQLLKKQHNNTEANLVTLKSHCQQQEEKRNSPTVFKS